MMDKDIAHVLIDVRTPEAAERGYIKGAVAIPLNELAAAKDSFPADKAAPVILYSDTDVPSAFITVRGWGYKDASLLNGGLEGWKKSGGALQTGKTGTVITYIPKPRPGEISVEEFKAIAEQGRAGVMIIDVRETDEAMHGMIKGAVNIPAEKIRDRAGELPKDKEFVVHCVTGIRAEMAYDTLKELGYRARFLNAVIQIDNDGKYEITKK